MSEKKSSVLRRAGWAFAMLGVALTAAEAWKQAQEKRERESASKDVPR